MLRLGLLALIVSACGPRLPDLPSAGGPEWHELTSMHIDLWTDAPVERGRALVQQMEWIRSVIYGAVFPNMPPGGRTFVVALRDRRESRVFTPPYHDAYATNGDSPILEPMIVLPADAYGDDLVVTHELVHAISYNAVHHQPRWFAEGLASYLETIDLDMAKGTVDIGALRREIKRALQRRVLVPAATMFACARIACTDDYTFYATAWTMLAYLRTKHPAELEKLEQAFDRTSATEAWHAVFPELDAPQLDLELRNYLLYGSFSVAHFTIERRAWPISVRTLSDADVHAVRALLLHNRLGNAPAVAQEVEAALATDATNVLAHVMFRVVHGVVRSPADVRAVAAAHPNDYLAWLLVMSALPVGEEHDAALAKACALIAANPSVSPLRACAK